jgi:hypothetical protein
MFNSYKVTQSILSIFGIIMILFFISANIMYFYPYTIVKLNCPGEVINKEVKPGGVLNYRLHYNNKFNTPDVISQQLFVGDKEIVNYGTARGQVDTDKSTIDMQLLIPKDIVPGTARVKIFMRYKMFRGMRIVNIEKETEPFIITEQLHE